MLPAARMHDALSYEVLSDGTEVVIRKVRADDGALLLRGFAQLGADSRYQRFFTPKARLSDDELAQLTHTDGVHHYALGALRHDPQGSVHPLGLARYVRLEDLPDVAYAAIVIVDAMHGKGLGKLLLQHLSTAAYHHGVRRFRCEVLEDNVAVHKLIRLLDPHARVVAREPGAEELELVLPSPSVLARRACRRAGSRDRSHLPRDSRV